MAEPAAALGGRMGRPSWPSQLGRWKRTVRPQAFAGRLAEPVLGVICTLALAALLAADVLAPHAGTLGALGIVPVCAAAWLLSRPWVVGVTAVAIAFRLVAGIEGDAAWSTALAEAVVLPLVGYACYLGASSRSDSSEAIERERRLRELSFLLDTAQLLASSLEPEVILERAVESTARGVARGGGGRGPRAEYHRVEGEEAWVECEHDDAGHGSVGFRYVLARNQAALGAMRSGHAGLVRPDHLSGALREQADRLGVKVMAMAPVRSGNDLHGLLVATARDHRAADRHQLRLLEVIAQMTGLALVNAEHLQRERLHGERMEGLEKVKSQILNLVSHELRSPLTVAMGYVAMLEDGSLGMLDEQPRSVLPIVGSKLAEMEMLVHQMLEASRLEETEMALRREVLDLRPVVQDAVRGLLPITESAHRLSVATPPEPVLVEADRGRLATILGNLLSNAVKYSPRGGEIRCALTADGEWARVAVSDQGLGISAEDLPKLFARFGRIMTAENRGISGTGLGLYLSRELARQHGGDITVTSRPGAGSTFTLALPVGGGETGPGRALPAVPGARAE